jgi:thiaminase
MTTEEIKRIIDDERAEQLTAQTCCHWLVVTLGKTLNGGKQSDTYKKYISTKDTDLNPQAISELTAIMAKERA